MGIEFFLARRYLWDRRHGAMGWFISLIAIGSVALGVAALIVTLAVMTGFRADIQKKILGVHPHIFISSFSGKMAPDKKSLIETLNDHPAIEGWSPYVNGQILLGRGKQSAGATLKGIIPGK